MAEADKPVNPLEREERVGIRDGSDHTGERVTPSRHGIAKDPADDEVRSTPDRPRDAAGMRRD